MDSSRAFAWFMAIGGRIAFLALWLFSPVVSAAFGSPVVPILGFIFAPLTALTYSLFMSTEYNNVLGIGWVILVLVLMFAFDLGADIFLIFTSRQKS